MIIIDYQGQKVQETTMWRQHIKLVRSLNGITELNNVENI